MCMTKPITRCPICQAKSRQLDPPDDVFPVPGVHDAKDVLVEDLRETINRMKHVINDAHFYMYRDGNSFKAFKLLDEMVALMGDTYQ